MVIRKKGFFFSKTSNIIKGPSKCRLLVYNGNTGVHSVVTLANTQCQYTLNKYHLDNIEYWVHFFCPVQ